MYPICLIIQCSGVIHPYQWTIAKLRTYKGFHNQPLFISAYER